MKKSEAVEAFGGQVKKLAEALDRSPQAISLWPEHLSDIQTREVLGAAVLEFGVRKVRQKFPDVHIPS